MQNAEALADQLTKLVYTASRVPVSPDRRETFQKISGEIFLLHGNHCMFSKNKWYCLTS